MENSETYSVDTTDILVLQGDDRVAIDAWLAPVMDAENNGFAGLNVSRLNGAETDYSQVSMQLNMLPLGQGKRIVIVDHAFELLKSKGGKQWLKSLLEQFSPTTFCVFILDDEKKYRGGKYDWEKIKASHWIRKSLSEFSGKLHWQELPLPRDKEMPAWIVNEAKSQGGNFHPAAAHTLSLLIGNNLYQAKQEIAKAIAYVGTNRQVTSSDIQLLCAKSKEDVIFELLDAVGMREGKKAMARLQDLSRDMPLQYIFTMLVRQIRSLIQTKIVLAGKGGSKAVVEACDIRSEWQAKKLINQANRFSLKELESVYKKLDFIDERSKIGQVSLDAALDGLIAEITTR